MIRPATAICVLIFVGSGMFLYQTKHESKMLDLEIEKTERLTAKARSRVRDLQTAYSELNDPSRLQALADQHLPRLKPALPGQYASLADLGRRLPAPGAIPVAEPPAPDLPASLPPPLAPTLAPTAAPAAVPMVSTKPVPAPAPTPAPLALAVARPAPAPAGPKPTPLAVPAPVQQAPAPHAPAATTALAAARPAPVPRPAPAPAPVFTPMAQTPPAAQPPRVIPAEDLRRIANGAPVDSSQPAVASALGMARSMLTAPTPVTSANAARPGTRP